MKFAVLALSGVLSLASCGTGNSGPEYSASGTWTGKSTNLNNDNFEFRHRLIISDNGGTLTGTAQALDGSEYVTYGTLTGTRKSDNRATVVVTVTYEGAGGSSTFSGEFSGNTFTGNYTASGGGAGPFIFTRNP